MKRILLLLLINIILGLYSFQSPEKTFAEVNVNFYIGAPLPQIVITSPPEVVLIPETNVYFTPDVGIELLFYSGCWYRRHNGLWYRATYYNGPWLYLEMAKVPAVLVHLPKDYHRLTTGYKRIPYGQLKKQWKKWKNTDKGKNRINLKNEKI
ncbi:MAG: hypothetical protein AB1638_01185 [Nitrospirota bacterium]